MFDTQIIFTGFLCVNCGNGRWRISRSSCSCHFNLTVLKIMIDPLNSYWVILWYFDLWFTPIIYLLNQGTFSLRFLHFFYKFNTHCMSLLTISQVLILLSSVCHCHVCFHSKSTISWQQKHDRTLKSQQNRRALQSVVLGKQVWPCILVNELN